MQDSCFRTLDIEEEKQFRQWVHDNIDQCLAANADTLACWHPVVRDEISKLKSQE